jgi:hypothetical protein
MKMFKGDKEIARDLGYDVDINKRGRMRADITAAVREAKAKGTHGLIVKEVTPRKRTAPALPAKSTPVKSAAPVVEEARGPIAPTYRDETHQAYAVVGYSREKISLRNACQTDGVSLYFCTCGSPVVSYGPDGSAPVIVEVK